jgi:(p)ppGpp synthase/HD superfamily hydrolase
MSNLSVAISIAANGFKNKYDKGGQPYILHCLRVMNDLHTRDEELQSIAVLHDCIEDGVCTVEDLVNLRFSQRVIFSVILLTHSKEKSYEDYIKAISTDNDATLVKLADLRDNTKVSRLKGLTKKDFDRMEKYHKAYIYLSKI